MVAYIFANRSWSSFVGSSVMIIVLAEEQQPYSAMVVLYVFSMDSKIWGLALC